MIHPAGVICMWFSADPDPLDGRPPDFEPISKFFGIWHEHKRGAHNGIHEFYWEDRYILLINIFSPQNSLGLTSNTYSHLKPDKVKVLNPKDFESSVLSEFRRKKQGIVGYPASSVGENCDQVSS